jgi:hypothetical protein
LAFDRRISSKLTDISRLDILDLSVDHFQFFSEVRTLFPEWVELRFSVSRDPEFVGSKLIQTLKEKLNI